VNVDKSLCIGCCSCEIIAPDVFEINKKSRSNPKSSVINQKGAGVNKIMNAAETCPTKAIRVENSDTNEKLFPH
jgi:ferredoxin